MVELLPVVWLCGPPASGKTVTAWEVFQRHCAERVAFLDVDQLRMLYGVPRGDVLARHMASAIQVHRRAGVQALLVSGTLEAKEVPVIRRAVTGTADLRFCELVVDPDALRARNRERGLPEELADDAISTGEHFRQAATPDVRIPASRRTLRGVADLVEHHLKWRPVRPVMMTSRPPALPKGCVVIFGARGVGCSTAAWNVTLKLSWQRHPTALVESDQLGFVHAPDEIREVIRDAIMRDIAVNFAARTTLITGEFSVEQLRALAGEGCMLVRLDASEQTLRRRIATHAEVLWPHRPGDDLVGAHKEDQAAILRESLQQTRHLAVAPATLHITTDSLDPDQVAHRIINGLNLP